MANEKSGGRSERVPIGVTLPPESIFPTKRRATGTVVGGKIAGDGDPLPAGTVVTIIAREQGETFVVPHKLEAELLAFISEADRRETIPVDELVERLIRIA